MAHKKMTFGWTWDEKRPNYHPNAEYQNIFFRSQEAYFNDRLKAGKFLTVNDIADALGFDRTPSGMIFGWDQDDFVRLVISRSQKDGLVTIMVEAYNIWEAMTAMTQTNAPIGTVATLGHPANKHLIVKAEGGWRSLSGPYFGMIDPEEFRAGWDIYDPTQEK